MQFWTSTSPESIQTPDENKSRCVSLSVQEEPLSLPREMAMAASTNLQYHLPSGFGKSQDSVLPLTATAIGFDSFQFPPDKVTTNGSAQWDFKPWSSIPFEAQPMAPHLAAMSKAHDCYATAISTLDSLSCDPTETPLAIDQVLRGNKTAITVVRRLLACTCAADPRLAMLYGSITAKIMSRYQTASMQRPAACTSVVTPSGNGIITPNSASTPSASSSTGGASLVSMPHPHPPAPDPSFTPLPSAIGSFELDADDRTHLGWQLLLSEFHKASGLIDALATTRPAATSTAATERVVMLYATLGAWLRCEWTVSMREIKQSIREIKQVMGWGGWEDKEDKF